MRRFSNRRRSSKIQPAPLAPPPARSPLSQRPLVEERSRLPIVLVKTPTGHPFLYRKRIARFDGSARPGDLVEVRHDTRTVLGYGLFNPRSEVTVRMLNWGTEPPDSEFWNGRLRDAIALRRELLGLDSVTDAYRVVHAEGDGLSGIVVDKLGSVLSAEAFSLGMFQRGAALLDLLLGPCGASSWILKGGPATLDQEYFQAEPIRSPGAPAFVDVQEFETRFRVRFDAGHKTGFFCDQRDNRRRLAAFCEGKSVLDLCCYSGGFALQAKQLGKAGDVTGVELDAAALELARENARLNQTRISFVQADAFAYLRDMLRNGRHYDVVVLDPPKLIRTRDELEPGRRRYLDLNRLAMQVVKPGGLLLSCTCSGLLDQDEFLKILMTAARQSGPLLETTTEGKQRHAPRSLQIIDKTGAACDHPVASNFPESEYLHAVWMRLG